MICQKRVPQKKRDPTKFNIKQQTLFHWVCSWELPMESTSAFQGPQHGGHIGQKTLVILMKKSTIIFTKIIYKENVLGPFDQSAYIHMRNLMKYFAAEVTVYFFHWDRKSIHNCSTIWEKCTKLIRQLVPRMNTRMQEELTGAINYFTQTVIISTTLWWWWTTLRVT